MSFVGRELKLLEQSKELKQLRKEVATLRVQNESMRQGMRRCVTCEYRVNAKAAAKEQK